MMEDQNFQEAVLMTYPERFSEEIITEKLIQYGVKCDGADHNKKLKLFYENVAALPQRDFKWEPEKDNIQQFKPNFNKPSRKLNHVKSTAKKQNETSATPEMDRLLNRNKNKPVQPKQPITKQPEVKMVPTKQPSPVKMVTIRPADDKMVDTDVKVVTIKPVTDIKMVTKQSDCNKEATIRKPIVPENIQPLQKKLKRSFPKITFP